MGLSTFTNRSMFQPLTHSLSPNRKVKVTSRGLQDGEVPTARAMVSTATQTDKMTYEDIKSVADYLCRQTKIRPKVGRSIVCGSGLGGLADDLDKDREKDVFPYKDIPKFPETTGAVYINYSSGDVTMTRL